MIAAIIRFSVQNKLVIALLVLALIAGGIASMLRLPIDAVPDITNNQVQVVTVAEALAPQEVEQYITYPVEVAMSNIPDVIEIRSISRYGLSVVTIVFEDRVPIMRARQFVKEQIDAARSEIPAELGIPELMPITTGLGEIYQYVLEVEEGYEDRYGPMELRTIQDWIVKRQLAGIRGIIEISSFGGYLKQYEVAIDPVRLQRSGLTLPEVYEALAANNQNTGGSYIEKDHNAYYIRSEGIVESMEDIEQIVLEVNHGTPVLVRDVAEVRLGSPKRFGAMTMDGKGEAVGGITLMFKGANSSEAIQNVHDRMEQVRTSLPEGVQIYPYLDRSELVGKTIQTVKTNLIEGGLIVILVLILLLGDPRAGLIVSSVIPLSMLFAMIMMRLFGVSANLMSLGAIDFGIVVDGAVIVVEGVLHMLVAGYAGRKLSQIEMDGVITDAASKLFRSAVYGVIIILVVFIPIMTLSGIEGKMFRPMAQTFSFAILGSLLLSLTYVPMMASLFLQKKIRQHKSFADRILLWISRLYLPVLYGSLGRPVLVIVLALALFGGAVGVFRNLGAEFIPTLEEGDLAMQMAIQPGSSLEESILTSSRAEKVLLENFPEVRHVVSKIGTAEVPTDPMAIEDADIMIILKGKKEWTSASGREELVMKMKEALEVIPGATFEFTQPIQLRFNELMTGAKTDISVKIFGEDTDRLKTIADRAAASMRDVPGAADVKVDQTEGLPQLKVRYDRAQIARYGLQIEELNMIIRSAYAGEVAGVVFENERKFDLVLRLAGTHRSTLELDRLFVNGPGGDRLPLSQLASVTYEEGPMQISRESARRFINIGVNVRNRDVASVVNDIDRILGERLELPPGYYLQYGGQFENLQAAQKRLRLAVPAALALIFILLYFTFGKLKYALMIITTVPMSAIGGIAALWIRGMPFSISSGVGFIALFGVAVLNGIVLIAYFNRLRYEGGMTDIRKVVVQGALARLRPVLITATVAALGFVPMALSTSNGAEVQRPLATVVIGGLITATILTLLVLPTLYALVNRGIRPVKSTAAMTALVLLFAWTGIKGQEAVLPLDSAIQYSLDRHPVLANARLQVEKGRLAAEGAKVVPPTEFRLDVGQINSEKIDYSFSASQTLGKSRLNKARSSLGEAGMREAERERQLLSRQLEYEVSAAWYRWAYAHQRLSLIGKQDSAYRRAIEKMEVLYDAGEISGLEKNLLESQYSRISAGRVEAEQRVAETYARLSQIAFLSRSYRPPADAMARARVREPRSPDGGRGLDTLFLAPWEERIRSAEARIQVEASALRPEVAIGYFFQTIDYDYAFQGVSAGIRVPIHQKHLRSSIARAEINRQMERNRMESERNSLEKELRLAAERTGKLEELAGGYGNTLQRQSEEILQQAEQKRIEGEIDYFDYIQSWNSAVEGQLQVLDWKERYRLAILYLEYLSQ